MANDVYQIVTDRIVSQLEQGVIPWRMPWSGGFNGAVSYTTGRPYSFLNQMLLGELGEYLTFNQVKALGGNVKKGGEVTVSCILQASDHQIQRDGLFRFV